MVKFINNLSNRGTVGVEHSDERLAATEEAKRTGQEFQSVGAKGSDLVDREVLRAEVEKVSNANSSDPNQPLPDYLYELNENAPSHIELNQRKADEHNEYSAELVRNQNKARVSDAEKLRNDPDYFANRIAEQNRRLAQDHNSRSADFVRGTAKASERVQEEVRELTPEQVYSPDPVTALGQNAQVTDISEGAAEQSLITKDRIIFGEESYKKQAVAPRQVSPDDERGQDNKLTAEPKRVEEPVRNQKKAKGTKNESPAINAASARNQTNVEDNEQAPNEVKSSSGEKNSDEKNSKE